MVFLSARRWNMKAIKRSMIVIFFSLFIGEYLVFLITAIVWDIPVKKSEDDLKVLFIADPQIQGFQFEAKGIVGDITRWDVYFYLKKTFSFAMNAVKPDVIVLLGDLLDEGYVASDEKFLLYKEWIEDIYQVPESVKKIYLAGDNDVGGEAEILDSHRLTRHEKHFGRANDIVPFKNWQFVKINTLSFLRFYQFTTVEENRILDDLKTFTISSVRTLDNKKHSVILSHLPIAFWDAHFAVKLLNDIHPRAVFSGHVHKASYRAYKSNTFSTEEHVVPTCSYRMGTVDMGIGMALFEKNGSFQYSVLKLPARYFYLFVYLWVFLLCFLYLLICGRIK